jgi:hypothetical protein
VLHWPYSEAVKFSRGPRPINLLLKINCGILLTSQAKFTDQISFGQPIHLNISGIGLTKLSKLHGLLVPFSPLYYFSQSPASHILFYNFSFEYINSDQVSHISIPAFPFMHTVVYSFVRNKTLRRCTNSTP